MSDLGNLTNDAGIHHGWSKPFTWRAILSGFFLTLALCSLVNYIVDPYAIYGTSLLPALTFNNYQNKLYLLRNHQPPPEALILGSSRMQCIDPEYVKSLTGYDCFNWEVPAAKAEVIYSCLRLALDEFNIPLKMVIIGGEPEVFHPTRDNHPQVLQIETYTRYFSKNSGLSALTDKIERLFTIDQLESSWNVIRREVSRDKKDFWITWDRNGFPSFDWSIKPDDVSPDFKIRLRQGIREYPVENFRIEEFTHLKPERKEYWEKTLKLCYDNDIEIFVLLPPLHPALYKKMLDLNTGPIFDQTAEYLRQSVTKAGGTFKDFRTLESFGGNPDNFRDAWHLLPANGEIMVSNLLSERPSGGNHQK